MSNEVSSDDAPSLAVGSDAARVQPMLEAAAQTFRGMIDGEFEIGVVYGTLAGLETAVVVLEVPGGLVPVFAHINENLAPVPRSNLGELPQPLDGQRRLLAS
jgi:hypothetical protein